jgi:hypothetical protein
LPVRREAGDLGLLRGELVDGLHLERLPPNRLCCCGRCLLGGR